MKALVGAFNQEKALVGAFSVIVKLMDRLTALWMTLYPVSAMQAASPGHGASAAARSNNSYQGPSVPQPTAVPSWGLHNPL